jgi:uncharacterized membrane protein YgcG
VALGELDQAEKARISQVISLAEEETGLEFCVVVGRKRGEDPRREAERTFHKAGLHERPAVMIVVTPEARTLEVVTAYGLDLRLPDVACDEAVRLMTGLFSTGDYAGGIERGVELLAERAGARTDGKSGHQGADLPNVVDLGDDMT